MFNERLINTLNFLRWVSALLVVLGHLRSFLFVSYYQQNDTSLFTKVFYFLTGFGHQAVMFFFVISGFLVGGKVLEKYFSKSVNKIFVLDYFIKRFSRIYVVLIPVLILGAILDYYGSINFKELYTNQFQISAMNFNVLEQLSIQNFIGNLLNLQTITVETLGSNGPLWSLAYEWSYYVIFILFFINRFTMLLAIALMLTIFSFNSDVVIYFSIWIFGAVTILINKRLINEYLSGMILILVLVLSRKVAGFEIDLLLALSLCLFLNAIRNKSTDSKVIVFKRVNYFLAESSYTLYLAHMPIIVFILSVLHIYEINLIAMSPSKESYLLYGVLLLSIYVYVYVLYLLFEKRTNYVKNKLNYFLNVKLNILKS